MKISLTQGKVAVIDDVDMALVAGHSWCAWKSRTRGRWYAAAKINGKIVLMHRLLTGYHKTDHWNGDGLNNRRRNLRPCTDLQNQHNRYKQANGASSRFKGVAWDNCGHKWRVYIRKEGVLLHLGMFPRDQEEAAARAYDAKAVELFGVFARTNFPFQQPAQVAAAATATEQRRAG